MTRKIIFNRNGTQTFLIEGREVSEAEYRRKTKKRVGGRGAAQTSMAYNRGLRNQSGGCHPSQVAEFNACLDALGVTDTRYLPTGEIQFDTRAARREELKRRGWHDRDGGYSD